MFIKIKDNTVTEKGIQMISRYKCAYIVSGSKITVTPQMERCTFPQVDKVQLQLHLFLLICNVICILDETVGPGREND